MFKRILKSAALTAAVVLSVAACGVGTAHAQSQTQTLNTQFVIGTNKTFNLATAKEIYIANNSSSYVVDYNGVKTVGDINWSRLSQHPLWKNYAAYFGQRYFNTAQMEHLECNTSSQSALNWTGRAPEALNDNCAFYYNAFQITGR